MSIDDGNVWMPIKPKRASKSLVPSLSGGASGGASRNSIDDGAVDIWMPIRGAASLMPSRNGLSMGGSRTSIDGGRRPSLYGDYVSNKSNDKSSMHSCSSGFDSKTSSDQPDLQAPFLDDPDDSDDVIC
jgi:hypothetical protein